MVEKLFYCYLDFQKSKNNNLWKNLFKLPWYIILYIIIFFVAIIATFVLLFLSELQIALYICSFFTVILSAFTYIVTEKFQIKTGDLNMIKYQKHCTDLSKWLKQNNITTDDKISLIHNRLTERINEKKSERKERNDRVDKWTQTLAIPVLVAIIAAVIDRDVSIQDSINFSLFLVLVFVAFYCLVWFMRIIMWLPDKRKIEQMKIFADDLQGLLDLHNVEKNIIVKKQHKIKVTKCTK